MKYFTLTAENKGELYKELKKQYGEKAYIIKFVSEEIEEKASGFFKKPKFKQIYKAYCGIIESDEDAVKAKKIEEKKTRSISHQEKPAIEQQEKNAIPYFNEERQDYQKISEELEDLKSKFTRLIENQVEEEVQEEDKETLSQINEYLWQNDFPLEFAKLFLSSLKVPVYNLDTFQVILKEKIRLSVNIQPGFLQNIPRFVAVLGASGSGKTTALVKLAAHFFLNEKKKIRFMTFDSSRLGGAKQIELFSSVLECPYHLVQSDSDLRNALGAVSPDEMVFIDTPGDCVANESRLMEINRQFGIFPEKVNKICVLDATSKYYDLKSVKEKLAKIQYDSYLITKIDETNRVGSLLSILYKDFAPTVYFTNGQSVPEDIEKADIEKILNRITSSM